MGKKIAKILLWMAGLVGIVLVVVASLLWWVSQHPDDAWHFAQHHILPSDLQIKWSEIHFRPQKITWLNWTVDWGVHELVIQKGDPSIEALIDQASLQFSFAIFRPFTGIHFDQILIHSGHPIFFQPSSSPKDTPQENFYETWDRLRRHLFTASRYLQAKNIDISLKDVAISRPQGQAVHLSIDLSKPKNFKLEVGLKLDQTTAHMVADLDPEALIEAREFFHSDVDLAAPDLAFNGHVTGVSANDELKLAATGTVTGRGDRQGLNLNPMLNLSLDHDDLSADLTTDIHGLEKPVDHIDHVKLEFNLPFASHLLWSSAPATFSLSAPIDLFFIDHDSRATLELSCACDLPKTLMFRASGRLYPEVLLAKSTEFKKPAVDVAASLDPVRNKLFDIALAGAVSVSRDQSKWIVEPKLNSQAHLHTLQGLHPWLEANHILLPAPLNVLDGTVDVTANQEVIQGDGGRTTPINMQVALNSSNQHVELTAETRAQLSDDLTHLDLFVRFLIKRFQIELPPLDPILGLPKVSRDPRIVMKPVPKPKGKSKFKVRLVVEAQTQEPGAIRLLSQYAIPNIPISVDARRDLSGELSGSVVLEPFEVRYLRRTVHVEQMRFLIRGSDAGDIPVDGRFRVDQTQYRIFIQVNGTLQTPSIQLTSEPYLPRSEIISVLLYDRTSDQLVSADAETAGNFDSAIADRAIGLFGLWAFASTPIKSFSYNPVTKVYAATVELAGGLTAGIGTNWEEAARLEVRKRVSRQWILTASWSPSDTDRSQVGKLVLQWEKRF